MHNAGLNHADEMDTKQEQNTNYGKGINIRIENSATYKESFRDAPQMKNLFHKKSARRRF
jgi:hypothetical protein